ncbi:MAG: hypothetical protein WBV82_02880 [Myxococcaceae bacterium]
MSILAVVFALSAGSGCGDEALWRPSPSLSISGDGHWMGEVYRIVFPDTAVGDSTKRELSIRNSSSLPTRVDAARANSPFSAAPSGTIELRATEYVTLLVHFTPQEPGTVTDTALLDTEAGPVRLELIGTGFKPEPVKPGTRGPEPEPATCEARVVVSSIPSIDVKIAEPRYFDIRVVEESPFGTCRFNEAEVQLRGDPEFKESALGDPPRPPEALRFRVLFFASSYGAFSTVVSIPDASTGSEFLVTLTSTVVDPCDAPSACIFETASAPAYVNTADELWVHDPVTVSTYRIGRFTWMDGRNAPVGSIADIAVTPDGSLYGIQGTQLIRIDPTTAEVRAVAKLPPGAVAGLGALPDGNLVIAGQELRVIAPLTGQVVRDLVPSGLHVTSGDVTFNPEDGLLYWSVQAGDLLVAVDPNSGGILSTLPLGEPYVFGLAAIAGSIEAFSEGGLNLSITPASAGISSKSVPGSWWGAASKP